MKCKSILRRYEEFQVTSTCCSLSDHVSDSNKKVHRVKTGSSAPPRKDKYKDVNSS